MIQLSFSHRTENLLATLAADLADYRARKGPWAPLHLVLPNPCVKQFVLEGLARGLGVVANHTTSYLEGFWRNSLPRTDPPIQLLDRAAIQGILLSLFQEPALLEDPELAPVRAYLAAEPRDLKAVQLSAELARCFEAYLLKRPAWAPLWQQGRPAAAHAPEALEAWQRRLWRELHARIQAARTRKRLLTFPEYVADPAFAEAAFPEEAFFFGIGPMAEIHHTAFARLARRCEARFYLWNPSREHWDDIRNQWGQADDSDDPFHLEGTGHLALQRWGRPGREHIREVLQLASTDRLRTRWDAPAPATLLEHLQHSIITLGTDPAPPLPAEADASLRIHACTGLRREAETVASAVWQTILDGRGAVRFSDLAVVLPDAGKAEYLDHLRVAFASTRNIPWELADEAPGLLRETVEAARLLLALARTELTRADVVCALTHPALRRRWAELPLENLPDFCDRAGIVIRFGAEDTVGTDQEGGLWTWERGLRRTALGHFLGAPDDQPMDLPPARPVADAPDLALFLRALLQDLRRLAGLRQSPREWVPTLSSFLRAYLGHPDGARGVEDEQNALTQVIGALAKLGELELPGLARPQLAFREAMVLAGAGLEGLVTESLSRLGRGVVVATHGSLRGIPFHTRFLMGLAEGAFPRAAPRDPMDLTACKRKPGDISPAEQDRYLFLESLMSARQALVLSYIGRDALTGEELQPSPLILDLRDLLLPTLGDDWDALTIHHPHHRHDLACFPELGGAAGLPPSHCPAARAEAEAVLLGVSLRAAAHVVDLPADRDLWHLAPGARAALDAWAGPLEAPPPAAPVPDRLKLSIAKLRKWLECQIQGGAALRLGLREEDEDGADLAEEPMAAGPRDLGALRKAALWLAVAQGLDAGAALDRLHRVEVEAARMPTGFLFKATRTLTLRTVQGWLQLLGCSAPVRHRFGGDPSSRAGAPAVEPHQPLALDLTLDGRPVLVQLEGSTEPIQDGWSLLPSTQDCPTPRRAMKPKDRQALLRAWMDHVLLAAAGLGPHLGGKVLNAPRDPANAGAWTARAPELTREAARTQLAEWVTAAMTERRWTLQPLEAVLEGLDDANVTSLGPWVEKALDNERVGFSSTYGPLPRVARSEATPVEPGWRQLAAQRLGSYPEWSRKWEAVQ